MSSHWAECEHADCRKIFWNDHVRDGQKFCSQSCARSKPSADDKVQAIMRAIEVEIRKHLK